MQPRQGTPIPTLRTTRPELKGAAVSAFLGVTGATEVGRSSPPLCGQYLAMRAGR